MTKINSFVFVATGRTVKFVDRDNGKVRTIKRTQGDGVPVPITAPRRRSISRADAEAEIRRIMEGQR